MPAALGAASQPPWLGAMDAAAGDLPGWRLPRCADVHCLRGATMMCLVPDDLVTSLGAVDERLVGYLDDEKNVSSEVLRRLQRFAVALSEGSMTLQLALEDWPDFYPLAAAFVVTVGSEELRELYDQSTVFSAVVGRDVQFTDADRVFLVALSDELERHADDRPK
ncbi:MAG: hypothetical protein ACRDXC_14300 [Acidimicrobiales bacterium]